MTYLIILFNCINHNLTSFLVIFKFISFYKYGKNFAKIKVKVCKISSFFIFKLKFRNISDCINRSKLST